MSRQISNNFLNPHTHSVSIKAFAASSLCKKSLQLYSIIFLSHVCTYTQYTVKFMYEYLEVRSSFKTVFVRKERKRLLNIFVYAAKFGANLRLSSVVVKLII
jgi:hypothetical protein